MKKKLLVILMGVMTIALAACSEADTVSDNLSQDADSFKIERKIVFFQWHNRQIPAHY
jgi:ABC-type glycerol-3-phosphate transport system substrate-binding protein